MSFFMYAFLIAYVYYNKKGKPWFLYHHIGESGVPTDWFEEHTGYEPNFFCWP